ncbi:MAG: DUF86 domain-containing protein [Candidatus Hydrogenedentes bacterium]|nr:DUF86 domain-containing protein [Candidatus Hydrogenedentota bacterium]
MLPKDDCVRLRHMVDAAREAMSFVAGRSRAELDSDAMLSRALVNCLAVVGEAAARLSPESRACDTSIPWPQIVGMRNRLIHAYFDIDQDEVWLTVTEDLPTLADRLQSLLDTACQEP